MKNISQSVSFDQAISLITAQIAVMASERVTLDESQNRVAARHICTQLPEPSYDQSLRDGFVIGNKKHVGDQGCNQYRLAGEIPAGRYDRLEIGDGEAYRIMTGGMIPERAERVVLQEECQVSNGFVKVPYPALDRPSSYIQRAGAFMERGSRVVSRGRVINARDIGLLATSGNHRVDVYRKPEVSFFCTGSELVDVADELRPGQKISSNRYLLGGLIKRQGAEPIDFGIVRDCKHELVKLMDQISQSASGMIISTGGMGPGKYDLLEALFEELGGKIYYRSIALRPGRATMFGIIDNKLYFGLPGPPSAVGMLFNELVLPAVWKMQGRKIYLHQEQKALLVQDISLRGDIGLYLKEGVTFFRENLLCVRFPKEFETPDCIVLLQGNKSYSPESSIVTVHALSS